MERTFRFGISIWEFWSTFEEFLFPRKLPLGETKLIFPSFRIFGVNGKQPWSLVLD